MEETINWLDSGIVCAARQERRKEGMPPGMFGSLKKKGSSEEFPGCLSGMVLFLKFLFGMFPEHAEEDGR